MAIHLNRKNRFYLEIVIALLAFSLAVSVTFVLFQYEREKQFKSETLNASCRH